MFAQLGLRCLAHGHFFSVLVLIFLVLFQTLQIQTGLYNNHIVFLCQNYADRERGEVEHLLDEVSASLDRIRTEVVGGIQNQLDTVMSKGEGLVNRLETELGQLTDRRATLEVQAISQDHIGFLQVRTEYLFNLY